MSDDYISSYINKILLPGGGRKYSGTHSKGLIWLKNEAGQHFPNHLIRKGTKSILLYSHGNGGSLGDFKSITFFYAQWFNTSVFAIEYPSYGPAEGTAGEESVNDNLRTAFNFLLFLGYPPKNIILMGYSIGTGPSIQLASELCAAGSPPGALVTVAAYLSVCDIVRDLKGSINLFSGLLAGVMDNRWDSMTAISSVTCPCIFVHGEHDEVIPCKHSEVLFERCGSSSKRLRICSKADHTHFEEPGDTVDPIAAFLTELFKPDIFVQIIQIPTRFALCPQSILDREALVKLKDSANISEVGFQKYGDNSESSCFSINDFLNWMIGIPNNDPPSRLESCISKNSNKMNINEKNTITLSALTTQQQQQQQNGNNNTTIINEEIAIGIRNVSSVEADLSASPSPVTVIPNNPITSKALKILKCYYDAFNDHNIPEAVGFLASDIKVTFPDSKKNWSSAAAAYDRYTTMFRKSPHLKGKFSLLDVTQQKTKTIITVYCHFTCIPSGVNTVREMAYIIENDIIQIINNKY